MFKKIIGCILMFICIGINVCASDTVVTHYEPYSDWAFDTGIKYNIIFSEKPQRETLRKEVISLLYDLNYEEQSASNINEAYFTDIDMLESKVKQKIESVAEAGIVNGYKDGTFRPNNPVTRAEFITFMDRFEMLDKIKNKGYKNNFNDVTNHWAKDSIAKAVSMGLMQGKRDNEFYPDDNISIEEVLVILDRLSKSSNIDKKTIQTTILNTFSGSARTYSDDEKYMVEVIYKEINDIQKEMKFYENSIFEYEHEDIGSMAKLEDILIWRFYYREGITMVLSSEPEKRRKQFNDSNFDIIWDKNYNQIEQYYFGLDGDVDYNSGVTLLDFLEPSCRTNYLDPVTDIENFKVHFSNISEYTEYEQHIIKRAVYKGLLPDSEYAFPGDSKMTKALLNYIIVKFNENRNIYVYSFHLSDKGAYMENDMSKMPSNYYLYPYIIRPVSNKAYEIPFMNNDKRTVWYPKDCYENLRYDYSNMNYFVKKYLNTITNIDYNTIDALKLSQTIEPYSKYDIELQKYDEYVKYVKDNKIIIEGTAQSCMPIVYYDTYSYKYRIRGKVNFKIKNSLTNKNILLGDLIFYGPKDYPDYKEKNVIYNGNEFELYVDIPVSRFWPGSSYNLDDLICVANNISLNEQNNIYIQEN